MKEKQPTEFIYNFQENNISKFLWYLGKGTSQNIYNIICEENIQDKAIEEIFSLFAKYIMHYGRDEKNKRFKFYINLYDTSFEESLKIISKIKIIIGETREYFLDSHFLKFDCIGIDIYPDKHKKIKIYEIVKKEKLKESGNKNIKEIGFLKDFSGRKKMFIRFAPPYPHISFFLKQEDMPILERVEKRFKISLEQKIKYYCSEGKDMKEIYFI